jgi:hypothetical protein
MSGLRAGLGRLERQLGKAGGNGRHRQEELLQTVQRAVVELQSWAAAQTDPDAAALVEVLSEPGTPLAWNSPELAAAVRAETSAPLSLLEDLYAAIARFMGPGHDNTSALLMSRLTPLSRLYAGRPPYDRGEDGMAGGGPDFWAWQEACDKARAEHPLFGPPEREWREACAKVTKDYVSSGQPA